MSRQFTYCTQSGSLSANFSSTLISNLAASLYFSTFFIIFNAIEWSLKPPKMTWPFIISKHLHFNVLHFDYLAKGTFAESAKYFICNATTSSVSIKDAKKVGARRNQHVNLLLQRWRKSRETALASTLGQRKSFVSFFFFRKHAIL